MGVGGWGPPYKKVKVPKTNENASEPVPQFYATNEGRQNSPSFKKRRLVAEEVNSFFNKDKPNSARFWILVSTNESKSLRQLGPFKVAQELINKVRPLQNCRWLRDGSLLVEARTNAQVAEIRSLTQINDLSIKLRSMEP